MTWNLNSKLINLNYMYSPLYLAEMKALYPHRSNAVTPQEVAKEMQRLIDNNITTYAELQKTTYGALITAYFPRCNPFTVNRGFDIYRKSQKNNEQGAKPIKKDIRP